jgi:hypothetical protein
MGDHRASIKIEFEMHGRKAETDMWINWSSDEAGIDRRIIEFFQNAADVAMIAYHEREWQEESSRRRAGNEENARLDAEYGPVKGPQP